MPIECRRLGPDWIQGLAEFFAAVREAGDDRHFHPHPLTDDEARQRCVYEGKDLYYILVDRTRVIGYGMLRGWDEGYEVPSLGIVIHPAERGKGLGRLFMEFLHAAARRRGAKQVRLKVYPDNHVAVALYRDLGYKFQGRERGQLIGVIDLPTPGSKTLHGMIEYPQGHGEENV